ncbi:ATP-binding protein [Pseudoclavibacter endophyticus]|uniref:DUF3107 domain-containing protein n=1 Tax=Pseudoclavibacter endophyticus TaxID=1778590 RepID=A0A6H9WTN9_9MICO|nr:DUF3107 domain-containing protein [Pseudoclavibacter endophyticus]KAB1649784.1 DUF3107 domain-containing protein [Pseudoclavibacter endophyticus]GGA59771.1 ATP-binding protein [Pseudoclavibacter endophyticus]
MELRIGIQHAPRELTFETEQSAEAIEKQVQEAFENDTPLLRFVDDKRHVYLVQRESVLYVEVTREQQRRVGFIA